MKRKYDCLNVDFDNLSILEYYGKLYRYLTKHNNEERIFGPPVDVKDANLDYQHDVFIYNIPSECYEDRLLPILFKPGSVYTLRILQNDQMKDRKYAFVTYFNIEKVQYACDLINNYEILLGCKLSAMKCRNINTIYIGNVKIRKINLYRMLSKLTNLLRGVKSITFYSVNKYGRYSLIIEFFRYDDTEMSLRMLLFDQMFQIYPEIIVDCCVRCGHGTEPTVTYEWEPEEDSRCIRPKITVLNHSKIYCLQAF